MASMRFSARLDTSHNGPPHLFKDAGVVAHSLTDIHNATMCLLGRPHTICVKTSIKT
jgi:hypothetical protein